MVHTTNEVPSTNQKFGGTEPDRVRWTIEGRRRVVPWSAGNERLSEVDVGYHKRSSFDKSKIWRNIYET